MAASSFWAAYGPNRFETLLLGVAAGLLVAAKVGTGTVAALAVVVAAGSYVVRRVLAQPPRLGPIG